MAIEVSQNEEISGGGKNGGRKGVGSTICWGRANRGLLLLSFFLLHRKLWIHLYL